MDETFDYFCGSRNWNSNWIWKKGEKDVLNSFYLFRKEFEYNEGILNLYITADSRYRLYINAQYVGYGSLQSFPHYKYYDCRNITQYLNHGTNTIAIIANYVGNVDTSRGGLLAEIVDEKNHKLAGTDETWKVIRANAFSQNTFYWFMAQYNPYQEVFNAALMPNGWDKNGYKDYQWEDAEVIHGAYENLPPAVKPWVLLKQRDIPFFPEKIYKYAEKIVRAEEIIDITNRMRYNDLSILLSVSGCEIKYSTIRNEENLLHEDGTTLMKNSTQHIELEKDFDGIYSPYIILDFGRIITAFIELDVEGPEAAQLNIGYSERLFNGQFNNSIENPFVDSIKMKKGRQMYRPFTWKAFRYVKIQLHDAFEDCVIHSIKAIISTFPFDEKGNFTSNDNKINKLYDICKYTLQLCSNEFIVDTPWREQGQFLGDVSMVSLNALYSCYGDTILSSKYLCQCAETQNETGFMPAITNNYKSGIQSNIIDFNFHWVNAIYNHYMYTGNENWIHAYYPHILKLIWSSLRLCDEYGMLNSIPQLFVDWVMLDRAGECAHANAIFYMTLGNVYKMAELKIDEYTKKIIKNSMQKIKDNFYKRFFNYEKGLFADANNNGILSGVISEHSNCTAILSDLCDEVTAKNIVERLYIKKDIKYIEAQPFYSSIVLKALMKINRSDLAIQIIRERWIKRMVDKGALSTYEEWSINGSWRNGDKFNTVLRTESHAWSAFPADFFIRHLCGIEILEPGCRLIKVNPVNPGFDFKSTFPTKLGNISVECKAGRFDIQVAEGITIL